MGSLLVFTLLFLPGGQPSGKLIVRVETPAQIYAAGIAGAKARQWNVAAERFRQAIERDGTERAGYFPHYWLGVAYDELHETAKALAEWRESQRQRAIAGTHEETAMKARMSALMRSAALPRMTIRRIVAPPPPPPVSQTGTSIADSTVTGTTGTPASTTTPPTATATTTSAATTAVVASDTAAIPEHHHDSLTPEGQLFTEIDQRFQALNPGQILINAPHVMRVGVTEEFVLRIASAGQNAGISTNLPANGQSSTSEIHVTPMMSATLAGKGFTIEKTSPEEQMVGTGSFTEWSWQVTPAESGDLVLVANVMVKLDDRVKAIPNRWPVQVSPNVGRSVSIFLASNWQWLSTTLIIPLILLGWRQRKKRK